MIKLSAYVITFNEEKRLAKTLEALKKVADEIVVVDSGSTDKTKKIAEKYNTKFIYHKWENYCKQKSFAEKKCTNDWVLLIDADEVLSKDLIAEIKQFKKSKPQYNAYNIKICNMFPNDEKPRRFTQTFNVVRLYNKKFAHMPPDMYNKDRVFVNEGEKIGSFKGVIHHYCFLTIEQAVNKYNLHSTELLNTAVAKNRKFSKLRLYTEMPRQFICYYFGKKYFLLGTQGFIQAMVLAYFRFLKIAKWFEWNSLNKK